MKLFPSQGQAQPSALPGGTRLMCFPRRQLVPPDAALLHTVSPCGLCIGCLRGEGAAVTCLQVRRPDGCIDWFLTPSFSSQPLGPKGNLPGGAIRPGLAMEVGLTLPQDPVIGSASSKWTETYWPCTEGHVPAVHHGTMCHSHLLPGVWSQEISHRAEQLRGEGRWSPHPRLPSRMREAASCSAECWQGKPWGYPVLGSRQPGPPSSFFPITWGGYLGQVMETGIKGKGKY